MSEPLDCEQCGQPLDAHTGIGLPCPEREPKCDHETMFTVNADGFCLVCGEEV